MLELLKWTACIVGAVGYALSGAGSDLAPYLFMGSTAAWFGIGIMMRSIPMVISPVIGMSAIIIGLLNAPTIMSMTGM